MSLLIILGTNASCMPDDQSVVVIRSSIIGILVKLYGFICGVQLHRFISNKSHCRVHVRMTWLFAFSVNVCLPGHGQVLLPQCAAVSQLL